jgi:ribosomal protein S18 acetylase RimI-like enzyme
MDFASPPANYKINKEQNMKLFSERAENNSFEAFWMDDKLIGLYWRKNAEIDTLAVSVKHQRKGYGSAILTRAIEMTFANTSADFVYLYAVDWNPKGQSFYKKYGMEQKGHSCLLRLNRG